MASKALGSVFKLNSILNVKDPAYGAKGDGVTNDAAAIIAARAVCAATGYTLFFPPGTYKYNGAALLDVDLGLFSVIGDGASIDFSAYTGAYAVQVHSSLSSGNRIRNNTHSLEGISFFGGSIAGRHGLLHGHVADVHNCDLPIKRCSFTNFDRNIEFTNNSWRATFANVASLTPVNYTLYNPAGLVNAGESMNFTDCRFESQNMLLGAGQWNFRGCSSLNCAIVASGDTKAAWTDGNMENPGYNGAGYYYVDVQGDDALFIFNGGRLTFNAPTGGGTWDRGLLHCTSNVNGIVFNGLFWPGGQAKFTPQVTEGNYVIVGGSGRVQIFGGATTANLAAHTQPAVALSLNGAMNGDFETATPAITPWVATAFGVGGSTATATAAAKRSGNYGLDLNCVANGGINVDIPGIRCNPGQLVTMHSWAWIVAGNAGNSGSVSFYFVDSTGADIGAGHNDGAFTVGAAWTLHSVAAVAPKGTASVRIQINAAAQNPAIHYYLDDLVINVT